MTTITWEIRIINMDGRFEIREYNDYNEAKKWCDVYGGEMFKVTREKII